MIKPFLIKITFQVTEQVRVEALSQDEAIQIAIESLEERHAFVHADTVAPID